ncbi:uncharacterized protein N7498_009272 [Penicillium cinerascens]|uniref:Uncharacterized protein n=1 Tax=Penicillium cinerascens TaxID=70096 RepID=A0A9W9J616_9EURO|nr:uncharacterized protein N7498_009272 [Penicillium cinerascens]KAJ5190287.1 hypothetical protein N7498_009272 [Penicillium cinerascens]
MHDDHTSSTIQLQDIQSRERLTETPATISAPSTFGTEPHSEDDSLSTQQCTESNYEPKPPKPSVPLRRTVYPVLLVLLYSGAALYAWVIICILTHRPIGGISYGPDQLNRTLTHSPTDIIEPQYLNKIFDKSERYLRAARVVQSLVSVVTIPLTSAVCSQAAVVYIQRKRWRNGPTLRQSMALADKGWSDIDLIRKLILGGWKKYSSLLLLLGLFLHLLGFTISPVQQLFLSYKSIKRVRSFPSELGPINQISDLFPSGDEGADVDLSIMKLRSNLASAINDEVQMRLWSRNNDTVSSEDRVENIEAYSLVETKSQNTLANLSTITDPFWAELPSSTTTGLLQEFAPRINSTAKWENNSDATLPADCHPSSDAFYLHYIYHYDDIFGYDIQVCMPGNVSKSPWKNQNNRQDISEELYLSMNFSKSSESSGLAPASVNPGMYSRKLTLQSTMGYFELPNYANGGLPGPLIEGDPSNNNAEPNLRKRNTDNDTAWNILNSTEKFDISSPKGPLLSIALALFGEGSFVDVQHTTLSAYASSNVSYPGCIALIPFISLLHETDVSKAPDLLDPCLVGEVVQGGTSAYDLTTKTISMHSIVAAYFFLFSGDYPSAPPANVVENAFAASAFLANGAMMADVVYPSLYVSYSLGVDMQIPSVSREGIIIVSVLLGLDLFCLLVMAIYSAWIPRWTKTLDSFAMLRIGASIPEKVPLLATNHAECIKSLDETPGWIGNEAEGKIGQLCLGGQRPLKKTKRYTGYDTDQKAQSSATREASRAIRREGYSLAPEENSQHSSH